MQRTPLENWIKTKIGADTLAAYQLKRLRETLRYVRENSRFYRDLLRGIKPDSIENIEDISKIPFTAPDMLAGDPNGFLCVPPHEVSRIVTLPTSGTTSRPKRLFFTPEDIELTVVFFHHGMSALVRPGERVMIFMPGETPDSVGDVLKRGLARLGCEGLVYGAVSDYGDASGALKASRAACAVGLPAQLLALSRIGGQPYVKSVLLSADYVPRAVIKALEETWNCKVFTHFGMTETCYGGAVECAARAGAHMREADLLFEIVDPETGAKLPDGEPGELVFTTLTRRAMPLIRYRTGDYARILAEPCPCGNRFNRIDRLAGRIGGGITVSGVTLTMPMLDEVLFAVPGLRAFEAEVAARDGRDLLILTCDGGSPAELAAALRALPAGFAAEIRRGVPQPIPNGMIKRRILDTRV
ncbi:MAG: AMP-binding protein [Oscillospiraceae bacterium]|jgi:phenylacetate-coenzyme A ligase PaaK-like adenylate-forming protein|nr:AMP-binding protein [Oscillospiraceae bacterium]